MKKRQKKLKEKAKAVSSNEQGETGSCVREKMIAKAQAELVKLKAKEAQAAEAVVTAKAARDKVAKSVRAGKRAGFVWKPVH